LAGGSFALGYSHEFQMVLLLVVLTGSISTVAAACQEVIRGFERSDVAAYATVGNQLCAVLIVVPVLLLGGQLRSVLLAQAASAALVLVFVWRAVKPVVGKISFRVSSVKKLMSDGVPFLVFGLAMVLQPNVDGVFLSKLAPTEAVGWYAAARKLVGMAVFPVGALVSSLYPSLCRLHTENQERFRRTTSVALRLVTLLVVPVTVACAMYPDVGIRIFSRQSFGPAADDLRVLSIFILLVYFTMTLGVCLLAAGQQRPWATTQFLCVVVSAVLDPILVPWFQARKHNGGLGICASTVASEVLMLVSGLFLAPKGIFDRSLRRELMLALFAGGVMVGVAYALSGFSPFLAGPAAFGAYVACLFATGAVDKEQVQTITTMLRVKMGR